MRFMMILKTTPAAEKAAQAAGMTAELIDAMGKFNSDMVKAGILLGGEGLMPSDTATTVTITEEDTVVLDGPFAETKELIAGFWLLQVSSQEEAVEWAKRIPTPAGDTTVVEVRRIVEADDFGDDFTPEARAAEDRLRDTIAAQHG
ncbi:YciI family protein [Sanguibacter sp. 25GB23B1]|uniref:YciI family protein n=1 Tax=unclassified Sanguibacter TaxID=2645534 RepID=UPI0032B02037